MPTLSVSSRAAISWFTPTNPVTTRKPSSPCAAPRGTFGSQSEWRWTPMVQSRTSGFGGPADKAKFIPGEKVMAVNGKVYSKEALHAAILHSKTASEPMHFILQNDKLVTL